MPQPKKIHLLFLTWEDDDLGMADEVSALQAAFNRNFAVATTETLAIPSSKYAEAMCKGLLEAWMADHGGDEESLLVVYYGGHGGRDESGYLKWSAMVDGGPSIDWHSVQEHLDIIQADILYLFDCCCSASSINQEDTYHEIDDSEAGVIEVIAACSFDDSTPGPSRSSFTNALTVTLNNTSSSGEELSISVLTLHRRILRTLRDVLQDGEGPPTAPIFFRLAGGDDRPSIALALAKRPDTKKSRRIHKRINPVEEDSDSEAAALPTADYDSDDSEMTVE
ncbi:hypothetical protein BKA64DRAFT_702470 [Cadophora sp. MPI-SDFR-AT-0126]|nr:hypothetical protein BKA64DRAFT_702470 [Leotiomycetes sp. MPI-SDFR-AT-0126]